jgi:hypothetical protein
MQPNKTKIALSIGVLFLGVSGTSNAATESFNISATTIADVGLVQVNGIDYGTNIFTSVGNCILIGNEPADLQIDPSITSSALDNGTLSGTSCVNGDDLGTPGEYTVTGITATDVTISMTSISTADFTFTPLGAASGYGNATPAEDDDVRIAVSSSGPITARTAGAGDVNALIANNVVDQQLKIFLGGTLNVLQTLTPSTPYSGTFDLTVTY